MDADVGEVSFLKNIFHICESREKLHLNFYVYQYVSEILVSQS